MNASRLCGQCGAPLGSDTLAGLCPQCMLLSAVGPDPDTSTPNDDELSAAIAQPIPAVTSRFGDYELLEEIAHGGMGVVYRARQLHLDRIVAIKMLLLGSRASDVVAERFQREAQAAARLRHPHIVAIHEVGEVEGQPFFSMDHVQGRDLGKIVREAPLPARRAATYVQAVAEAIHYAHQHGIIHRDLKPSNILIDSATDEVRITDFGLAKRLGDDSDLTLSGQVLGSPNHMAPELAAGHHKLASPASDVFSLGAILYDLLTGRPPFLADSIQATLLKIRDVEPVGPRALNDGIPRDLETICLKCLQKEPGARFGSAQELADELGRFLRGDPIRTRPVGPLERMWRWCRRNPVDAGLVGASVSLLGALVLGAGVAAVRIGAARSSEREQRMHVQAALRTLEITRAREMFQGGHSAEGLATLARLLRQSPSELGLAEWALLEVARRPFALPWVPAVVEAGPVFQAEWQPGGYGFALATAGGIGLHPDVNDPTRGWLLPPAARPAEDPEGWGRERPVTLSYAADGRWLATGGVDGTARVWDTATGQAISPPCQHPDWVTGLAFSPDGGRLATACRDGRVRLWSLPEGRLDDAVLAHQQWVNSVGFSPEGTMLVSASDDRTARVWSLPEGTPVGAPVTQPGGMKYAEFSPDGRRVVVAGHWSARVCEARTGRDLAPPLRHGSVVVMARFSPDGALLVTASLDRTARLWNSFTGAAVGQALAHADTVRDAVFSPDGLRVATASEDRTARLWDARTGEPLSEPLRHFEAVWSVRFSADGTRLLTASSDGTAQVWDALPSVMVGTEDAGSAACLHAEWSRDGQRGLVVTRSGVRTWAGPPGVLRTWPELRGASGLVQACFAPNPAVIATAHENGAVQIWSVESLQPVAPPFLHRARVNAIEFSPDGNRLASASSDGTARIWPVGGGVGLGPALAHEAAVLVVSFSPEGTRVATASADRTARIWEAASGQPLIPPLYHGGPVTAAAFSPDGQRLLTSSQDRTARLWDARNGKGIGPPLHHGAGVTGAWFSPDGAWVLTTSSDHSARLWDGRTGHPVSPPLPHEEAVTIGAFSPDGRRVATGTRSGWVGLWEVPSGDPVGVHRPHTLTVRALMFHPHGPWLLSCASDRLLRITELPRVNGSVPDWLPGLIEAVAQYRLDDGHTFHPVSSAAFVEMRRRLMREAGDEGALAWGRWVVSPRAERTLSPGSADPIQQLAFRTLDTANIKARNQPRRRAQFETLFPFYRLSGQALALLANQTSLDEEVEPQWLAARLDWLSREAVRREPASAVAWWSRATCLNHLGERDPAIALLQAWAPKGENAYIWLDAATLLEAAGRQPEALQALDDALAVAERAPNWTESGRNSIRKLRRTFLERHPELAQDPPQEGPPRRPPEG